MLYNVISKVYNCARLAVVAAAVTTAFSACEKMTVAPTDDDGQDANVTLHFGIYQQQDFAGTRSAETLTDQCSKLSVAIFRSDGSKAKSVLQNTDQDDFGTVAVSLAEGTYTVVAVAHNGLGTATVTSPEKVTFTSNKVTDTFVYCGSLTIGGSTTEQTMQMERRVAMVRLTLTDEQLPADVDRLKFYYTGGSSTLNPSTGYGCVQSKQTEYRSCKDGGGETVRTYDLYTLRGAGREAQSVTFAPDLNMKLGPYFGWKWFFAGYTFELGNINLARIKQQLYDLGATYAAMSGSGSSLFGLFREPISLDGFDAPGTFKQIILLD